MLDGSLSQTKSHDLHREFLESRGVHIRVFIWILDSPKMDNEKTFLPFMKDSLMLAFQIQ